MAAYAKSTVVSVAPARTRLLLTEWDPPGASRSPPPASRQVWLASLMSLVCSDHGGLLFPLPQKCSFSFDFLGWRTRARVGRAGGARHAGPVYPRASTLAAETRVPRS